MIFPAFNVLMFLYQCASIFTSLRSTSRTGSLNDVKNTIRSDQVCDDAKPNLRPAGALRYHRCVAQIEFA